MSDVVILDSAVPWHPAPYCIDRTEIGQVIIIGVAPAAVIRLRNGESRLVTRDAIFATALTATRLGRSGASSARPWHQTVPRRIVVRRVMWGSNGKCRFG
jgi:hypothetical protein